MVQAPGKVFVAGEYSVLAGGWSLVSTLGVHARASLAPPGSDPGPQAPLVRSVLRQMDVSPTRICPGRRIVLDLEEFYSGGVKKGIGSSAAGTASVMGLVRVLTHGAVGRRDVLGRDCAEVHRGIQGGRGSGADAAACARGGVIRFRMPRTLVREQLPEWLTLVAVALGVQGRTAPILDRHEKLVKSREVRVMENLEVFAEAAERIMDGIRRQDWHSLRLGVNLSAAGYEELSDLMDAELVTGHDRLAMKVARRLSGVSRPTGAGGGDLHLAYFGDDAAASRFERWASDRGYVTMRVIPDRAGTHVTRS